MLRTLLLSLLLLAVPCAAQTWSKLYPGTFPRDILVEPSGEVIVLCADSLLVLDPDGDVVTRVFSSPVSWLSGICKTSDGGYGICGRSVQDGTPYAARLDANFDVVWDWSLPYFYYWGGNFESIFQHPSGHLHVVGYAYYSGSSIPGGSPLHLRVDFAGGVVQDMRSTCECWVDDAAMRPDGSYFTLNTHASYYDDVADDGDLVLELWDAAGNLIAHTWAEPGVRLANRVHVTADGGCLVTARHLIRFDAAGKVTLQRDYEAGDPSPFGTTLFSAVETPDGGAIVAGSVRLEDRWHGRLLKLDASYAVEWDRAYGDADGENSFAQVIPYQGGYLAIGTDTGAAQRTWVVRTDANGEVPGCESIPLSTSVLILEHGDEALDIGVWPNVRPTNTIGGSYAQSTATPDEFCFSPTVGNRYCSPANANSSGLPAELHVGGSADVLDPSIVLIAAAMPVHQFGYFVVGDGTGVVVPPGSQGALCIDGGVLHRYVDQIQDSGIAGVLSIYPDTATIPGHGAVQPGETWNFQAWFRDQNPSNTSNFTDAVGVTFH